MEIRISEKAKRQLRNIYNYYSENYSFGIYTDLTKNKKK